MADFNNELEYQNKVFDKFLRSLFNNDEEEKEEKPKPELPPLSKDIDEEPPLFI